MDFNTLLVQALKKAGKQEQLATQLDLGPSELNKRLNGQVGWQIHEIEKLLQYVQCEIVNREESQQKIEVLKQAIQIMMEK